MTTRGLAALIAIVLTALMTACSGMTMPAGPPRVGLADVEGGRARPTTGPPSNAAQPTAGRPAPDPTPATGTWRGIASPPLTNRTGALWAWTGEELIVVGGHARVTCDPADGCAGTTDRALTDGAAYDPITDTWRRIADLPEAPEEAKMHGVDGGAVLGRPDDALWRYDAAADRWRALRRTRDGLDGLAVSDAGMVAFATTHEVLGPPDHVHDPDGQRWRPLPPDPLGLMRDRRMIWAGDHLVLIGQPIDPELADPLRLRAAWLEDPLGEEPRWHELPDTATASAGGWVGHDDGLIHLGPGGSHERPHAAVLQLDPAGWFELPRPSEEGPAAAEVQVPPSAGDRTVVAGDHALDLTAGTWAVVQQDATLPTPAWVTAWAGDRVVVWGGREGRAMAWLPPWADQPATQASMALSPQDPLPTPAPLPPPGPQGHPDGRIDCLDEARIRLTDLSAGTQAGAVTAHEALRRHLQPQADHDDGHVVATGAIHASVVVDRRETLNATALRQPGGGWIVGLLTVCGDVDLVIR